MATPWQHLTGWVQTGQNLSPSKLADFYQAGGRGILLLLYGDDASGPWNRGNIDHVWQMCKDAGLWGGAWHNCRGEDPALIAQAVAQYAGYSQLTVLDCEDAYQGANAEKLPELLKAVRAAAPTHELGISPKAVDNSMIWNGRGVDPVRSCSDLKVRVAPQWYSGYYLADLGHGPEAQARYLKTQQPGDINFRDPDAPYQRGVPISYLHPVLEATGVEGSSLADELARLETCKAEGAFTWGFGYYNLENASSDDLRLLASKRGRLFLT